MTETQRAAMQQALEALESMSACYVGDYDDAGECASCHEPTYKPHAADCKQANAIEALRSALAEPETEPAAKVELMTTGGNAGLATRIVEIYDHLRERLRPGQLLYTTPPARQPLTDKEMRHLWSLYGYKSALCMRFARALEAAHDIKEAK